MDYFVIAQVNLVFQVAILLLLFAGLVFKSRSKLFSHGVTMLTAVILNAVSFILVMGPSFFGFKSFLGEQPLDKLSLLVIVHAGLGSLAEVLGIWISASWHLHSSIEKCVRRKRVMLVVAVLWLIAISLGVLLYMFLYTNLFR